MKPSSWSALRGAASKLSSGERQLVSLLDEPTANLDFSAIEQLRAILRLYRQMAALPDETRRALCLHALNLNRLRLPADRADALPGENLLSVTNLRFSYDKRAPETLSGASLTVREHETVALIGANGCGKTTLAS